MADYFISRERAGTDLLDCAAFLAERIKSSDGHAEAMKAVIPLYLAKNEVDLAAELANAIDDPFSRDRLLIEVAVRCAEIDDEEYALQLVEAIDDHGMQAQAFERIGLVIASKGQDDKASEVADLMGHPDLVLAGIAVNQASRGNDAAAEETIDTIEFPSARVAALQQIATAKIKEGKTDEAIGLIEKGVAEVGEIEHHEEQIRALCELGSLFLDAKVNGKGIETYDMARSLAERLDNQHRDYFLVLAAIGFLNSGSEELADRTLDLVTDKTHMASALVGVARWQWGKEKKEDAIDSLEEAYDILRSQHETETRDTRAKNGLFGAIAVQFAGFERTERGTALALENPDATERMNALAQIAQILTVRKEDEMARDTVNLIQEDQNRLFALIGIADAKRRQGQPDEAIMILDETMTLVEAVPQYSSRTEVLCEIAQRFAALGAIEKARAASWENLSVISEIRDETSRAAAIAELAQVYDNPDMELGEQERRVIESLADQALF